MSARCIRANNVPWSLPPSLASPVAAATSSERLRADGRSSETFPRPDGLMLGTTERESGERRVGLGRRAQVEVPPRRGGSFRCFWPHSLPDFSRRSPA